MHHQIAVSVPRELGGMLLYEFAHAHWLLAGDLEHIVGHAVDAPLSQ
jgi:hypothetical protein